jgi:hypothetical protein
MAMILLVLVGYGAIAGVVHGHGNRVPIPGIGAPEFSNARSGDDNSSSKKLPGSGECLVCQFHQHLYSGLIAALPHLTAVDSQFTVRTSTLEIASSQTLAPRQGRAPPTSLL